MVDMGVAPGMPIALVSVLPGSQWFVWPSSGYLAKANDRQLCRQDVFPMLLRACIHIIWSTNLSVGLREKFGQSSQSQSVFTWLASNFPPFILQRPLGYKPPKVCGQVGKTIWDPVSQVYRPTTEITMEPPGMHLMRMKHLKCDYAIMSIIKMNMNLYESKFLTPGPKEGPPQNSSSFVGWLWILRCGHYIGSWTAYQLCVWSGNSYRSPTPYEGLIDCPSMHDMFACASSESPFKGSGKYQSLRLLTT